MADNLTTQSGTLATIPATTTVATDDVSGAHYQRFKLTDGTADSANHAKVSTAGSLAVDQRPVVTRISVTPTISTSPAYSLKDCLGSYMTFSSAVRASGGSGRVQRVQVVDLAALALDLDLLLFDRSISGTTTATDNANFDLTDADAVKLVGVVPIGAGYYSQFNDNAVADIPCDVPFVLSGTADLTGLLVIRATGTFASTSDITVTLHVAQD